MHIFLIKYFFLSLHEGLLSQEKPLALKTKHPALQNNTFLNFLFSCGSFCLPASGSGSSRPKTMRIHADPDPQHWQKAYYFSQTVLSRYGTFSCVFAFSMGFLYLIFYAPQGKWLCVMNCSLGHQGHQQSLACWQQLSLRRELDVHSAPIWYLYDTFLEPKITSSITNKYCVPPQMSRRRRQAVSLTVCPLNQAASGRDGRLNYTLQTILHLCGGRRLV